MKLLISGRILLMLINLMMLAVDTDVKLSGIMGMNTVNRICSTDAEMNILHT